MRVHLAKGEEAPFHLFLAQLKHEVPLDYPENEADLIRADVKVISKPR